MTVSKVIEVLKLSFWIKKSQNTTANIKAFSASFFPYIGQFFLPSLISLRSVLRKKTFLPPKDKHNHKKGIIFKKHSLGIY